MKLPGILYYCFLTVCLVLGDPGYAPARKSGEGKVTLRLSTVAEFKPFIWTDESGTKGIDVDIVREMCRRMDLDCRMEFHPWKRVLSRIRTGASDGGFAGFRTPERTAYAHFPDHPLHFSTYNLFVKSGKAFDFSTIPDLYGKTIGIQRGFKINREFQAAVERGWIKVEEVDSLEQNIRKLLAGRSIDAVAVNYHKFRAKVNEMKAQCELACLPVPITPPRTSYLMISKKWDIPGKKDILKQMSLTLKSMYDDGTIDTINASYLD